MKNGKVEIVADAGHGGGNAFNRGSVIGNEGDNNFRFSKRFKERLEATGNYIVYLTRNNINENPSLSARGRMGAGKDVFFSHHTNALSDKSVTGVETFNDVRPKYGNHEMAKKLNTGIAKALNTKDRGVKYRALPDNWYKSPRSGLSNYYGVLRSSTADINMLVEHCFHTNWNDLNKFLNNFDKVIDVYIEVLDEHFGFNSSTTSTSIKEIKYETETPILGSATASKEQAREYLKQKGANIVMLDNLHIWFGVAQNSRRRVDPIVAIAQSCKETNYFHFTGVVPMSYNNPCGLKTTAGGGDYDVSAHKQFKSWRQGITAQLDHLALYAGKKGSPWADSPDPRHFPSIKGTAKTVEELGGKWAPSITYGEEIVDIMELIQATKVEKKAQEINVPNQKTEVKIVEVLDEETAEQLEAIDYLVAYRSDGDISNAVSLAQQLDGDVVLIKSNDVSKIPAKEKIQVGGLDIKGIEEKNKVFGKNRVETFNKIDEFAEKIREANK